MILFQGIKYKNGLGFVKFSNADNKSSVEIPLDEDVARHISLHLSRISPGIPKNVEHGNDEESD